MESTSEEDIKIALNLLQKTRERMKRCYEKHREERVQKQREYRQRKKLEKEKEEPPVAPSV